MTHHYPETSPVRKVRVSLSLPPTGDPEYWANHVQVCYQDEDPTFDECEESLDEWMNSRARKQAPAHREATKLAAESDCLICGVFGCVPAHFPRHRGLGGGHAGWDRTEYVPLCTPCHDLIDRRLGASAAIEERRIVALLRLEGKAAEWWGRG
jgi:hypothetical protein